MARVALVGLLALSACASLPDVTYMESDGAVSDGTLSASSSSSGGASGGDGAGLPFDAGAHDSSVDGSTSGGSSSGGSSSGGSSSGGSSSGGGMDAGDAGEPIDATTCLPPTPPPGAACCTATLPCVGMACSHCNDCEALGTPCTSGEFCCATLNGGGKYKSVICSDSGQGCP